MSKLRSLGLAFALLFLCAHSTFAADPVNINSADAKTLAAAISGVGLKRAEAIIAYRTQHGPFQSVDELSRVKGVGKKTVENSRENLAAK